MLQKIIMAIFLCTVLSGCFSQTNLSSSAPPSASGDPLTIAPDKPVQLKMPRGYQTKMPLVWFNHGTHGALSCDTCHVFWEGQLKTKVNFYRTCPHNLCQKCHQHEKATGRGDRAPTDCGKCHVPAS